MGDNYERLYSFINQLGFSIYRCERLESFSDYFIEGCSKYFCVRASSDRFVESLEVRSSDEPDNWYDLGLVMACVGLEDKLDEPINLETDMKFVESHLDELSALFDEENYSCTKKRLEEFGLQRAKKAFPRWFDRHEAGGG